MGKIYVLAKTTEKFNRCVREIIETWPNEEFIHLTSAEQIKGIRNPYCVVYGSLYSYEFQEMYPHILAQWKYKPFPGFSVIMDLEPEEFNGYDPDPLFGFRAKCIEPQFTEKDFDDKLSTPSGLKFYNEGDEFL